MRTEVKHYNAKQYFVNIARRCLRRWKQRYCWRGVRESTPGNNPAFNGQQSKEMLGHETLVPIERFHFMTLVYLSRCVFAVILSKMIVIDNRQGRAIIPPVRLFTKIVARMAS